MRLSPELRRNVVDMHMRGSKQIELNVMFKLLYCNFSQVFHMFNISHYFQRKESQLHARTFAVF